MAKAAQRFVPRSKRAKRYKRTFVPRDLNTSANVAVSGKAFPVTLMTDLKWGNTYTGSLSNVSIDHTRFRANSIYDPDYATGTGQTSAYGLDIFSKAYQTYEVKAFTIDVRMAPLNSGQAMTGAITFITGSDVIPGNGSTLVARALTGTLQTFTQGHPYVFKRRYKMSELNNIIPALRQSGVSTNPPIGEIMCVSVLNPNTTSVTLYKTVKIIYHVQFSNRKQITESNV